nr:hypothetical protein [Pandoravirus massiliensis]
MVTEPLDSLPPPARSRRESRSRRDSGDDSSTFSHRSMLTDTSTFSSSDGKHAYKKVTVTTTTTVESTEPRSPVATSTSRSSSNWSCGWDAPLISEPTLSSLPTYTFDSDHDKKKRHAKGDKKDRKNKKNKKSAKKADDREQERKGAHKARAQQHQRLKRRPTDAETDAEAYRADRASDPWLARRSAQAASARSAQIAKDPWSRDIASEADASAGVYHSSDDHAVANTSSWPLAARKSETSGNDDDDGDDGDDVDIVSQSTKSQDDLGSVYADSTVPIERGDHTEYDEDKDGYGKGDDHQGSADQDTDSYSSLSASSSSCVRSESASTVRQDDGSEAFTSSATSGYVDRDHEYDDDDDNRRGYDRDSETSTVHGADDNSGGISADHVCRCLCARGLDDDDDDDESQPATSSSGDQTDGVKDASWDSAPVCTCHYAQSDNEWPASHTETSVGDAWSSLASSSSSSSLSSSQTAHECATVKINDHVKKSREPPVYIRACHRVSTHRRGSLCDDQDYDDDEEEGVLPVPAGARTDGVVETTSVTVAEPSVRPCEPDAPHAIYGRPRRARDDAKPSAPVVVAPGVCDLPGGATESFCALGATYRLLAGAVDTQCRLEAALVALQPRACAQPCFVFAGSDVSFVGVSGTGVITINGRAYPLTATAYFYVRAGSSFAVSNSAGATPLVFVQQFVGAAAGLGFYREVATYEASVGGAVNVDPRVVEAIAAHYQVRAAAGPESCGTALGNRWNTFVPPGVLRFVPTPLCENEQDESTSSSSSSSSESSDDDDDVEDESVDEAAKDAGLDSWGLRRRQLLVLAAVGPCQSAAARPAATVRPTDLDAFVAVGALGSRVTVRATIIRDPRFGGCPDVLARPTINGAETATLATGVSYWTYYDEAEDNVIVQSLPGSRLPPVLPQAFGMPQALPTPFAPLGTPVALSAGSGLPPISVRPLPFA